jgi:hypothetical protein
MAQQFASKSTLEKSVNGKTSKEVAKLVSTSIVTGNTFHKAKAKYPSANTLRSSIKFRLVIAVKCLY